MPEARQAIKKVLIFSLAYYPSFVSGAEAAIKEITDRISPSEIEFHLLTHQFDRSAPRVEKIGHVTVHRVGFGWGYLSKILYIPLAALAARKLHREHAFSGMWAMMTYMLFPVQLARALGVTIPHLLTLQDGDPYEKVFERWFIRPFTPILDGGFKEACVIQVISEYLGRWPKKRGYQGEVIMVRNGANPKNLVQFYSDEELQAMRTSLGKGPDDVYLFIAARLVYQKAVDMIIRALMLLPRHVHLWVAGAGPDEAMLRSLTKELQLEERVHFLGVLERDDVPRYRNAIVSDIFIHPSRSEGLGNSVLSAMAARLPVIATQVGGFEDYIFDAQRNPNRPATAFAVDPDSPEQIAERVLYIVNHPEEVQQTVANARTMIENEYNWERVAHSMKDDVFARLWKV